MMKFKIKVFIVLKNIMIKKENKKGLKAILIPLGKCGSRGCNDLYLAGTGIVQSIIRVQFPMYEGDWLLTMKADVMKTKGAE